MKYFTLSYFLTGEDYEEYDAIYISDLIKVNLKKTILYLIPVIIFCFIDISLAVLIALMALVSFLLPIISCKEYGKRRNASFIFDRETAVDFYGDHIIVNYLPNERHRGNVEIHYGFDKVYKVIETGKYFYFMFKNSTMVLIPKSAIGEQEYSMIKNLINNFFMGKYFFIQLHT